VVETEKDMVLVEPGSPECHLASPPPDEDRPESGGVENVQMDVGKHRRINYCLSSSYVARKSLLELCLASPA